MTRLTGYVWRLFSKYLLHFVFKFYGIRVKYNSGVIVYGMPIIELKEGAQISIGNGVVLCSHSNRTALGVSRPVIIRAMQSAAVIEIGSDVGLSGTTICAMERISIGDECLFGADVTVFDNDFHPTDPVGRRFSKIGITVSPVIIGRNVFIGTKTIIMKGVTIGDNSIIGAGSVVVSSIPKNVIAAGNPCKVIKTI
jgi:acetyltransferase-like isoleucine patch superfamily enzyme